jgi:adenylate kinase family enzyme
MKEAMQEGKLMPNYVVANALGKELSKTHEPVLLDGFPRSQDQMMMFQHDVSPLLTLILCYPYVFMRVSKQNLC